VHHTGSLTPSVYLKCEIPDDHSKSFVRGNVTKILNNLVFQVSTPFRYAVGLVRDAKKRDQLPGVLLKFADGGTDQCNTLESVKCSLICVF
jgi:hypothetical protein